LVRIGWPDPVLTLAGAFDERATLATRIYRVVWQTRAGGITARDRRRAGLPKEPLEFDDVSAALQIAGLR